MIEINLLPDELRKTEGSPPARLLSILLSVVAACCLGVFIGNYRMNKIPQTESNIKMVERDNEDLTKKRKKVEEEQSALNNLEQKVKALDNLGKTRILYGRLLTNLWKAIPDNCWLRDFQVTADNMGANPTGGKRYTMSFSGRTTGAKDSDRQKTLHDLIAGLKRVFEVSEDTRALPGEPLSSDKGFNKFNNARFSTPFLQTEQTVDLTQVKLDPQIANQVQQFKTGLDFQMTMSFELPAPVN